MAGLQIRWENGFKDPMGEFDTTGTIYEVTNGSSVRVVRVVSKPEDLTQEEFDRCMQVICREANIRFIEAQIKQLERGE
jgi:hypothetical protein